MLCRRNNEFVRVVTNLLQDVEGRKVEVGKIKERTPAPLSTMPTGLLNSFTRDEILDLIGYLQSIRVAKK